MEPTKLCGTFKKSDCCGTPSGYAMGCRSEPCRSAGIKKTKEYYDARPKKGSQVPVNRTRNHLIWLISKGAIESRIAEKLGVTKNTVYRLKSGINKATWITTEEDVLAMHLGMKELFVRHQGKRSK